MQNNILDTSTLLGEQHLLSIIQNSGVCVCVYISQITKNGGAREARNTEPLISNPAEATLAVKPLAGRFCPKRGKLARGNASAFLFLLKPPPTRWGGETPAKDPPLPPWGRETRFPKFGRFRVHAVARNFPALFHPPDWSTQDGVSYLNNVSVVVISNVGQIHERGFSSVFGLRFQKCFWAFKINLIPSSWVTQKQTSNLSAWASRIENMREQRK